MIIREAKLSDYEELMKLYNLFYGLPADTGKYSKHDYDSFKVVLRDPHCFVYVAEDNYKLVGLASLSTRNVVRYPRPIVQLEELFVLEQYRKRGVGKKIIEQLEIKSKELNCMNIYIESASDLQTAHKFYENLGYKKSGYYFKKIL